MKQTGKGNVAVTKVEVDQFLRQVWVVQDGRRNILDRLVRYFGGVLKATFKAPLDAEATAYRLRSPVTFLAAITRNVSSGSRIKQLQVPETYRQATQADRGLIVVEYPRHGWRVSGELGAIRAARWIWGRATAGPLRAPCSNPAGLFNIRLGFAFSPFPPSRCHDS